LIQWVLRVKKSVPWHQETDFLFFHSAITCTVYIWLHPPPPVSSSAARKPAGQVDVEVLFRQFFQGELVGDEGLLLLA
jgi:hypothetical protein